MNIDSTSKYIGKARFARHWWSQLYEKWQKSRSKREWKRVRKEMRHTAESVVIFRKDGK